MIEGTVEVIEGMKYENKELFKKCLFSYSRANRKIRHRTAAFRDKKKDIRVLPFLQSHKVFKAITESRSMKQAVFQFSQ